MSSYRVGIGHDTHRLEPGRPLRLGGVSIPHSLGLVGHSDADALLHAITDAILGALGREDIGEWFPDTAPEHRGADSAQLLARVCQEALQPVGRVINVDCILFAQQPKLTPYKQAMRGRIAEILGIAPTRVNVKAKTGERVGPIGREEAISAEAVVLVELFAD